MRDALLWTIAAVLLSSLLGLWFVVYQIVRQQGRLLLRIEELEESAVFEAAEDAEPAPIGLPEGESLPSFRLPDLAGRDVALGDLAGQGLLLVNWSPDCGFCELIAPELARLVPALRQRQTELVFASYGSPGRIRAFHEEHGLEGTVLVQENGGIEALETFGTPVAYLLDARRRVAKPLAVGADEVLELAQEAAGSRKRLRAERSLDESRIEREGLRIGTPAPLFALPDVDGKTISLESYRGRKVLLVFSDPHCGPCDELAPELARLDLEHRGNGLQVLMVGRGDPNENRRKVREHGLQFPIVLQHRWRLSKEYGIFATPVAFLIDEQGVIARQVASGSDAILDLVEEAVVT